MAMHPLARPSRPSVRLTALLLPVITSVPSTAKVVMPSGTEKFFRNGKYSRVAGSSSWP